MTLRGNAAAAALLLAVGVTGCAPTEPSEPVSAAPSAAPTQTAQPGPDQPEPRFELACDDIAGMIDFSVFPRSIELQDANAASVSQGGYINSPNYATQIRTYGGLTCSWSDGLPEYFPSAQDRQYPDSLLEVIVLPDARDFAASMEFPPRDSSVDDCTVGYQNLCIFQKMVGEYWMEVTTTGADPADSVTIISTIESEVAGLAPARPQWSPTPAAPRLPASCATVMDENAVSTTYFGGEDLHEWVGSSLGNFAIELTNAKLGSWTCTYSRAVDLPSPVDDETLDVSVSVAPNSGWAVAPYSRAQGRVDSVVSADVSGLDASESAFTACRELSAGTRCVVHMNVDDNWISVSVQGGADPRKQALDLAASVVGRIR